MTDAPAPARQRSQGRVGFRVSREGGAATRLVDLSEAGPSRLRLPRLPPGPCEAVLLNTAGGVACGDTFAVEGHLEAGADLVLTTIAAEKIYRSDGPVSRMETRVTLGPGARLAFLPQETILFDGAALRRRFEADLAPDARLLVFEAVVFGRAARGEDIASGAFEDVWRIRRDGRLAHAESLRLEGAITESLARAAIGGGARAVATLIDASPEAQGRLDEIRAHLDEAGANAASGVEAGASAWGGRLVVRLLSRDAAALRRVAARVLTAYRGAPMPRVWQS